MPTKIIKTKSGKFRVKYYAANGEMLAHSEILNSKQSANKNIKAMAKLFVTAMVFILASCATPKYYIQDADIVIKNNRVKVIPYGNKLFVSDTVIKAKLIRN